MTLDPRNEADRQRLLNDPDPWGRGPLFLDFDGNPISALRWVELKMGEGGRVARDHLPDGRDLSTVWLGLAFPHGDGDGRLYESALFDHQGRLLSSWPWDTRDEAAHGHQELLDCLSHRYPATPGDMDAD